MGLTDQGARKANFSDADRTLSALERTLQVLIYSPNVHATQILIGALDSPYGAIRDRVAAALLERRDVEGHLALLARWDRLGTYWQHSLCRAADKLSDGLTLALRSEHADQFKLACRFAVASRSFNALGALLDWIETGAQRATIAAQTVLELAEELSDELSGPRDYRERRDPQRIRAHFVSSLERLLWSKPQCVPPQVMEAFLLLAGLENASLRRILEDEEHGLHGEFVEVLLKSTRPGVLRLLVKLMEVPASSTVRHLVARRQDIAFVRRLARALMGTATDVVERNLQRTGRFAWIADPAPVQALEPQEQVALFRAVVLCQAPADEKVAFFQQFCGSQHTAVRAAVVRALASLPTSTADALIVKELDDPDVTVQCEAIRHLSQRPIENRLEILLAMLERPHPEVQQVAREALRQCDLAQYLGPWDELPEEKRRVRARLVLQVDPEIEQQIRDGLKSPSRVRQVQALRDVERLGLIESLRSLIEPLADSPEDSPVRDEARRLLQTVPAAPDTDGSMLLAHREQP